MPDTEIWVPAQGFPGYEVSTNAHVRSAKGWLKPRPDQRVVMSRPDKKQTTVDPLVLMIESFRGDRPEQIQTSNRRYTNQKIGFHDGDPTNRTLSNVYLMEDECCPHGHPKTGPNLVLLRGHKRCKVCLTRQNRRIPATTENFNLIQQQLFGKILNND